MAKRRTTRGWNKKQKSLAVCACEAIGWDKDDRQTILRQYTDAKGNCVAELSSGEISSTAPGLTDAHFERFMATVEGANGNRIRLGGKDGKGYPMYYWQQQAADLGQRQRYRARAIAAKLETQRDGDGKPLLEPDGVGLRGWISKRVAGGRTDDISELDQRELGALIDGLTSYAKQHGVVVGAELARGSG